MDTAYRFELMDPRSTRELEEIATLLKLVFPKAAHLTARYLDWQYANNPDGDGIGCNAYSGGQLVGHMAATPMAGSVEGERRPGLFMLNGAIHPDHRGRKLQSGISAVIFEESVRRGFHFCFGTGNKYSTGPLLTRFQMLRPLEARLGLGTPRRIANGPRPSFERVWSDEALRWRLANPERPYSIDRCGESVTILARTDLPAIDAILYGGADQWNLQSQGSRRPLRLWLGLDPAIAWSRSRFVSIPRRLRPSPLNLVYKDLTGGGFLPDPDRVTFRAIDFDPY